MYKKLMLSAIIIAALFVNAAFASTCELTFEANGITYTMIHHMDEEGSWFETIDRPVDNSPDFDEPTDEYVAFENAVFEASEAHLAECPYFNADAEANGDAGSDADAGANGDAGSDKVTKAGDTAAEVEDAAREAAEQDSAEDSGAESEKKEPSSNIVTVAVVIGMVAAIAIIAALVIRVKRARTR